MKVDKTEAERLNDLPRAMLLLSGMKPRGSQLGFRQHEPGLLPPAAQRGATADSHPLREARWSLPASYSIGSAEAWRLHPHMSRLLSGFPEPAEGVRDSPASYCHTLSLPSTSLPVPSALCLQEQPGEHSSALRLLGRYWNRHRILMASAASGCEISGLSGWPQNGLSTQGLRKPRLSTESCPSVTSYTHGFVSWEDMC